MNALKNTWYVAGWADEVGPDTLLGRRLLDVPVLLFRAKDGVAVAIGDRCPHRFAPLHMGRHVGDAVQCGYHGLEFNGKGQCVRNPHGNGATPSAARVPTYPLVERHALLWIWMGEAHPDESLIPNRLSFLAEGHRVHAKGHLNVNANYQLLNDNLMDLSHGMYLHRGSLSTTEMGTSYHPRVWQEGDSVFCHRESPNIVPPSLWTPALPKEAQRVDFFSYLSWSAPSNVVLEVGCRRVGLTKGVEGGISAYTAHLFTPETEQSSHYFFSFSRDFAQQSSLVDEHIRQTTRHAFVNEDKPMIEAQQRMMEGADLMSLQPVLLPSDTAAVRVRRALAHLIEKERTDLSRGEGSASASTSHLGEPVNDSAN
jgi:phenylpropionate dioxygenase-like ring-hydroxylating dioxygenase large terminal subunit